MTSLGALNGRRPLARRRVARRHASNVCLLWQSLALFPFVVSAADVWWTTGTGCTGANEHGAFSGKTVSQCAALCVGIAGNGCISFEFRKASGSTDNCFLSASCNTLHSGRQLICGFSFEARVPLWRPTTTRSRLRFAPTATSSACMLRVCY